MEAAPIQYYRLDCMMAALQCYRVGDMFVDGLQLNGDSWTVVNPSTGDSLANVLSEGYDGIVITGSHYNVRDQKPWYAPLCDVIRHIAETGSPTLYGGCFGHQLIAHALGGEAGYNEHFVMKAETIHLLPAFSMVFSTSTSPPSLQLLEVHGDCVVTLPPKAELLAHSASCPHEMFVAGAKQNILCCQSHPEFDVDYCFKEKIWATCEARLKDKKDIAESKASLDAYVDHDAKIFLGMINEFLRRQIP
ncbi:Aste57867_21032 [Aphanomyces stellatus]|uniref:Aste57867_21032 protein n=1 Tax=Aphanomyces stellatus TaxID=120398 RepID=A0A485LGL2_9STRA|nr:hypothetical protein As57867_020964 [Aphanomyces stellatus]VFT97707.1 Aste57867_21032 [Aphanomyces stellatus]